MTVIDRSRLAPRKRNFPILPELERLLKAAGQSASVRHQVVWDKDGRSASARQCLRAAADTAPLDNVTIRAAQHLLSRLNHKPFGRHLSNRILEARVRDQRSGANLNPLAPAQGRGGA